MNENPNMICTNSWIGLRQYVLIVCTLCTWQVAMGISLNVAPELLSWDLGALAQGFRQWRKFLHLSLGAPDQ